MLKLYNWDINNLICTLTTITFAQPKVNFSTYTIFTQIARKLLSTLRYFLVKKILKRCDLRKDWRRDLRKDWRRDLSARRDCEIQCENGMQRDLRSLFLSRGPRPGLSYVLKPCINSRLSFETSVNLCTFQDTFSPSHKKDNRFSAIFYYIILILSAGGCDILNYWLQ